MKELKIISAQQQNDFYNVSKSCNGGGYDQPFVRFEFAGIEGFLDDTSCGEFGRRYSIEWNGSIYELDEVNGSNREFSNFDKGEKEHQEFVEAFNSTFSGRCIYFKQDVDREN